MAAEPQTEFASHERASRPRKHSDSLPRRKLSAGINAALLELYPSPIARQTLLDLFENRATFASITAWRFGWVIPPAWAAELLKNKLRARIANLERLTEMPSRGPGPGKRGAAHWRAWRARQAEEREKKRAAEAALAPIPR
jgi:hypothetical protein